MNPTAKTDPQPVFNNVLPGEAGGETAWFDRLNEFEQEETRRQVHFKHKQWPTLASGPHVKHPNRFYPHILPADFPLEHVLYDGFAAEALDYFRNENIEIHSEFRNLRSSQACCVNFLFPLRQNLELAAKVFDGLLGDVEAVSSLEFEYAGPQDGGATVWLGEPPNGKRGQYRTSIDAAVFWTDRTGHSHATFIEWKYTETNFGGCSAYADGSTAQKSCCQALHINESGDHASQCLLTQGGDKRSRHYWKRLAESGLSTALLAKADGCPFQGPFYQLMRQHLLAHYERHVVGTEHVEVISIGFAGNKSLHQIPHHLDLLKGKEDTILDVWNRFLPGHLHMRHLAVGLLTSRLCSVAGVNNQWRAYLKERYGV